jgi:hypothetical protein
MTPVSGVVWWISDPFGFQRIEQRGTLTGLS